MLPFAALVSDPAVLFLPWGKLCDSARAALGRWASLLCNEQFIHGLINYIDTKANWRHLKKLPVKGLCGRCLSELWTGDTVSHGRIFYLALWIVAPLTFSLVQLFPTSFPLSKYSIYRRCVAGMGWGVLSFVKDHIPQEFNTLYLTRFRTYKIARQPQTKT